MSDKSQISKEYKQDEFIKKHLQAYADKGRKLADFNLDELLFSRQQAAIEWSNAQTTEEQNTCIEYIKNVNNQISLYLGLNQ